MAGRGCSLTSCDKLLVHGVLLLSISDAAEGLLSTVGHGVCLQLSKMAQVPIRDSLEWVRKQKRKPQTNTACDFGLMMQAARAYRLATPRSDNRGWWRSTARAAQGLAALRECPPRLSQVSLTWNRSRQLQAAASHSRN